MPKTPELLLREQQEIRFYDKAITIIIEWKTGSKTQPEARDLMWELAMKEVDF